MHFILFIFNAFVTLTQFQKKKKKKGMFDPMVKHKKKKEFKKINFPNVMFLYVCVKRITIY